MYFKRNLNSWPPSQIWKQPELRTLPNNCGELSSFGTFVTSAPGVLSFFPVILYSTSQHNRRCSLCFRAGADSAAAPCPETKGGLKMFFARNGKLKWPGSCLWSMSGYGIWCRRKFFPQPQGCWRKVILKQPKNKRDTSVTEPWQNRDNGVTRQLVKFFYLLFSTS